MMNEASVKASVMVDPKQKFVLGESKRLRVTLSGVCEATGKAFYVPAELYGKALKAFLENGGENALKNERKRPVVIEGKGWLATDSFTGRNGERVYWTRVKIASEPKFLSSSLKMVENARGELILAKASLTAKFSGKLQYDADEPSEQFGQRLLVREDRRAGSMIFVRVPVDLATTGSQGSSVSLEGRISRMYPRGTDAPSQVGIFAHSLDVQDPTASIDDDEALYGDDDQGE